jgi:hypothetical protein
LPWDQSYRTQRQQVAEAIGLATFIEQFPLASNRWSSATPELVALAAKARRFAKAIEQGLGIRIKANDTDTALVGALLLSYGIITTSRRARSSARSYGADADQLKLLREAAERLQRKGLGQAPPSAVLEGFANKTACGGAPVPELASPWRRAASCEQLAIATSGNDAAQLQSGGAASKAPTGSRHRPPHHHWGPGGAGHRGPASRR